VPNLETRMVFRADDQSTPTITGVANALAGLSGEAESSADRLGRSLANIRDAMDALDRDDFGKAMRAALKENQYAVDAWEQQTNLAFARIEQQARLRAAGVEASLRGMGVRSMSSIRDEIKGLGDAYSFAKEGGAQPGELAIAKENVIARVRQLAQEYSNVKAGISSTGQAAQQAEGGIVSLSNATGLLTRAGLALGGVFAAGALAHGIAETGKEAVLLAARFDTLGVVMQTVGRNTGHAGAEMDAVTAQLQRQGISMLESRQQAVSLAAAHLDLSKASELARLAQDAAVISGENSSQAFGRMVAAIQAAQPEILRTLGIYVSFEDAYRKVAAARGIDTAGLAEQEKLQIRVNTVLAYAPRLMGTYEAAMETAGKQLSSFKRYAEDLKVVLGEPLQPAFAGSVKSAGDAIKDFTQDLKSPEAQDAIRSFGNMLAWLGGKFVDLAALPARASYRLIRDLKARQITENDRDAGFTGYWDGTWDEETKEKKLAEYLARQKRAAKDYANTYGEAKSGTVIEGGDLKAQAEAQLKQYLDEVNAPVEQILKSKKTSLPREAQLEGATKEWIAFRGQAERAKSIAEARGDLEGVRKAELAIVAADNDLVSSRKKINDSFDKGSEAAGKFEDRANKLLEGLRDQNEQLEAQLSGDSLAAALKKNENEYRRAVRDIGTDMEFAKGSTEDLNAALAELEERLAKKNELTRRQYWLKDIQNEASHLQSMADAGQGDPWQARIYGTWEQAVRERVQAGNDEKLNLEAQARMEARILAVQRDQTKARAESRAELARLTGSARAALDAEIQILEVQREQAKTGEERALIEEKIARLAAKRNLDVAKLVQFGLNDAGTKAFDDLADKIGNALPSAFDALADTGISALTAIASGGFNAQQALASLTGQVIRLAAELAVAAVKMQVLGSFSRDAASVDLSSVGTGSGRSDASGMSVKDVAQYASYGKDAYNLAGGLGGAGAAGASVYGGGYGSTLSAAINSYTPTIAADGLSIVNSTAPTAVSANAAASSSGGIMSVAGPAAAAGGVAYLGGQFLRPDAQGVGILGGVVGGGTAAALSSSTVMGAAGLTALGGLAATGVGALVGLAAAGIAALATPESKKSEWSVAKGSKPAVLLVDGQEAAAGYGVVKTTTSGMMGATSTRHTTIFDLPTPQVTQQVTQGMAQAGAGLTSFSRQLGYTEQNLKDVLKGLSFPAIPVPDGYEGETYRNLANLKTETFLGNTGLKGEADQFLRSGEAYIDEMTRMATATEAFENIAASTGFTLNSISRGMSKFAAADLGSRMIEGAGGVDVLAAALARLNAYGYSQSEQISRVLTANAENAGRSIALLDDQTVNIENFWGRFREEWERGMDPSKMPSWALASQRMEAWENVKAQARQIEAQAVQADMAAKKEQLAAAQELRKTWGDVVSRVSKLSEAIRWDKQYSPLSGPERQAELMAKLVKLRDAARSGDATDLGDVDSTVGDLLEVAKENLGATEEYFKVYDETQSLIGEIKSIATQQAATADAQVQQLAMEIATQQAQLEALNSINRGLGEVVGAVNNVSAAIGGAIQAANAAQAQASVTPAMVAQATPSPSFSYPQPEGGDGSGYAALKNLYGWSDLPGFEGGGDHPGGLRVVGEAGWEVEATGPARYYTHQQTRDLMSPVDMRPVVTVLGQVVDVLDDMRRESRQQSTVIADKLSGVRQGLRNVEERL